MPTFRRVKVVATVQTPATLLTEDRIDRAISELRDTLNKLDLEIVSVEAVELAGHVMESSGEDPWSVRGNPVE